MFATVSSTNNALPLPNASVPRDDQRPARVVDHAQRSAVSLAVVPAPPSVVVRLSDLKEKEEAVTENGWTYTERGRPPKPISLEDNAVAPSNELKSMVDTVLNDFKGQAFIGLLIGSLCTVYQLVNNPSSGLRAAVAIALKETVYFAAVSVFIESAFRVSSHLYSYCSDVGDDKA